MRSIKIDRIPSLIIAYCHYDVTTAAFESKPSRMQEELSLTKAPGWLDGAEEGFRGTLNGSAAVWAAESETKVASGEH